MGQAGALPRIIVLKLQIGIIMIGFIILSTHLLSLNGSFLGSLDERRISGLSFTSNNDPSYGYKRSSRRDTQGHFVRPRGIAGNFISCSELIIMNCHQQIQPIILVLFSSSRLLSNLA